MEISYICAAALLIGAVYYLGWRQGTQRAMRVIEVAMSTPEQRERERRAEAAPQAKKPVPFFAEETRMFTEER